MNMSFLSGLRCLPWLPLFAALILTGCSETAGMRLAPVSSVSGTVSYKERIALPPDAELVVLLYQRTPDGRLRVAEDRTPTAGRNVPLAVENTAQLSAVLTNPDDDESITGTLKPGARIKPFYPCAFVRSFSEP